MDLWVNSCNSRQKLNMVLSFVILYKAIILSHSAITLQHLDDQEFPAATSSSSSLLTPKFGYQMVHLG